MSKCNEAVLSMQWNDDSCGGASRNVKTVLNREHPYPAIPTFTWASFVRAYKCTVSEMHITYKAQTVLFFHKKKEWIIVTTEMVIPLQNPMQPPNVPYFPFIILRRRINYGAFSETALPHCMHILDFSCTDRNILSFN